MNINSKTAMNTFLQLGVAAILLVILPIELQAALPDEITSKLAAKTMEELQQMLSTFHQQS